MHTSIEWMKALEEEKHPTEGWKEDENIPDGVIKNHDIRKTIISNLPSPPPNLTNNPEEITLPKDDDAREDPVEVREDPDDTPPEANESEKEKSKHNEKNSREKLR